MIFDGQKVIAAAASEIGVKESPAGTNLQKYGEEYKMNGVSWCAIFVYIMYKRVGYVFTIKGFEYVPAVYNYAKANGWLTENPVAGDLVIYDWQKGKPNETPQEKLSDHIGLFFCWIDKAAGTFWAIEGNTAVGNDSNGGQVMLRPRNLSFVQGFIHPKF